MPEGVITGGWPYVIWAYGLTAAVLVAYLASLVVRAKRAGAQHDHPHPPGESNDA